MQKRNAGRAYTPIALHLECRARSGVCKRYTPPAKRDKRGGKRGCQTSTASAGARGNRPKTPSKQARAPISTRIGILPSARAPPGGGEPQPRRSLGFPACFRVPGRAVGERAIGQGEAVIAPRPSPNVRNTDSEKCAPPLREEIREIRPWFSGERECRKLNYQGAGARRARSMPCSLGFLEVEVDGDSGRAPVCVSRGRVVAVARRKAGAWWLFFCAC